MSDLTSRLLETADAYCRRTGMSQARLATIVINDGKFFDRVRRGGGLTVKTYEKFMAFFAEGDPQRSPATPDQERPPDPRLAPTGGSAGPQSIESCSTN